MIVIKAIGAILFYSATYLVMAVIYLWKKSSENL